MLRGKSDHRILPAAIASGLAALAAPASLGATDIVASQADRIVTGTVAGDQLGRSVAVLGDTNGDGVAEIAVALRGMDAVPPEAGRVLVYDGLTGKVLFPLAGEVTGDQFGEALAAAGDVNDDGVPDVIVGAWASSAGGPQAGRAYVFSGADGAPLHVMTGESSGDNFGDAVGGAGDLNHDGHADVIVGAPTNDEAGTNAGRVYLYSGVDGSLIRTIEGASELDRLGVSVGSAGDVDGDGWGDVIAGAHLAGPSASSADNPGGAYVFSGKDGRALRTWSGEEGGDNFGWSVASAGDVDRDGRPDMIVGAPLHDALGSNTGRVYLYSGATGGLLREFTGEAAVDKLGLSVSGIGDLDGDGFRDVLAGAWWNDAETLDPGDNRGRAYVFSGRDWELIRTVTGEASDDHLGRPVAGGDLDGNGVPDLLIGARDSDAGALDAGRAYVILTDRCLGDVNADGSVGRGDIETLFAAWGTCPDAPVSCPADLNADGVVDALDLLDLLAAWSACP